MAEELLDKFQRSLSIAKELQADLVGINGTLSGGTDLLNAVVQAHTAHLINHAAIIKHVVVAAGGGSDDPVLQAIVATGGQMVKDARQLQEYVIVSTKHQHGGTNKATVDASAIADGIKGLQVTKNRGAKPKGMPTSAPSSNYRAPAVEVSEDNGASKDGGAPVKTTERKIKAHKKKKEDAIPTADPDAVRSSPKRQLEADEDVPTQTLVKRTKLSLSPAPRASKRKSDVSMIDVAEDEEDEEPSPNPKRRRGDPHEQENGHKPDAVAQPQPQPPKVEYDDITAEVDARMQQREQRKEREKKLEMGVVDKRKRMSNDSFQVEMGQEVEGGDKRERKRKKKRHSGVVEE